MKKLLIALLFAGSVFGASSHYKFEFSEVSGRLPGLELSTDKGYACTARLRIREKSAGEWQILPSVEIVDPGKESAYSTGDNFDLPLTVSAESPEALFAESFSKLSVNSDDNKDSLRVTFEKSKRRLKFARFKIHGYIYRDVEVDYHWTKDFRKVDAVTVSVGYYSNASETGDAVYEKVTTYCR